MWSTEEGGRGEIGIEEESMWERGLGLDIRDLGEGGSIGYSKGPKGFANVWSGEITFKEG